MDIAIRHNAAARFLRSLLDAGVDIDGFTELSERMAVASDWRACFENCLARAGSLRVRVSAPRDRAAAIVEILERFEFSAAARARILAWVVR